MAAYSLPTYAIPFIGRAEELSQIAALLHDPTCRLLTLSGPGGIGKTRLAVEVARRGMDDNTTSFSDGCCFAPLQPLTSPEFIVPAIADALHFKFYGEMDPKQQLLGNLREKHLLLLLDNFEHLAAGADLLPEMLEAAPHLKLLVTSRERLRLREEWLFDVGGLKFPENAQSTGREDFTAIQLFLQNARRAGYTPTDGDTASIVRICQDVEGIPLALELAAAWVRVMSCGEIAREVERSLDILTTNTRNMPEKHRSMRAAFDHSWALLTNEEQAVFRKLSVFRGGLSREGAEQVAGTTLAILASLVDKSLVQVDGTGRYDLHELLRQYAADKLRDAGEADAAIQRHLGYFLGLAEGAEAHVFGREQIAWFDRVEVELDNLRAALGRSVETETGLRLAGALGWFFSERTHWHEGLEWLERMLAANPNAPASLRAKALHSAGALAGFLGNIQRARAHCEQALALARAANDNWNIGWSLCHLGNFAASDPDQSAALLEESLAVFRGLGDAMGVTHTLIRQAWQAIQEQRDYTFARVALEEAAIYAREAGDRVSTAWGQYMLGLISWLQDNDLRQAKIRFESSVLLFREARVQIGIHHSLLSLTAVERIMGNMTQAQRYIEEALISLWENEPDSHFVPGALSVLASIAKARGQFKRAAILLGTANSDHWVQISVLKLESLPLDSDAAAVRTQLGETAFAEVWAAGTAMTREQAIAYALEEPITPTEQADESETAPAIGHSRPEPLSARELEVLSLVASGLSNREIAMQLFLTLNTVKWYLKSIFDKLHVASRTQAVARAQALGLLSQRKW